MDSRSSFRLSLFSVRGSRVLRARSATQATLRSSVAPAVPLWYASHHGYLSRSARLVIIGVAWLYTVWVVARAAPCEQDEAYHNFADSRCMCGCIPNFNDVASNFPFLVVGGFGIAVLAHPSLADLSTTVISEDEQRAWLAFYFGIALTAFGSAYYHWRPTSSTLVWDRLPMTVAFVSLFSALLHEYAGFPASMTLWPLLAVGVGSVVMWAASGDLRLYILVQFVPLVSTLLLVILFPPMYSHAGLLLAGLGLYAAAKVRARACILYVCMVGCASHCSLAHGGLFLLQFTEAKDKAIFTLTGGVVSGHTLKHLLAACVPAVVLYMLHTRSVL